MNEKDLASRVAQFMENVDPYEFRDSYLETGESPDEGIERLAAETTRNFAKGDMSKVADILHSINSYKDDIEDSLKEEYTSISEDLKEYMISRTAAHVAAVSEGLRPEAVKQQLQTTEGREELIAELNSTAEKNTDTPKTAGIEGAINNVFACIKMLDEWEEPELEPVAKDKDMTD